MSWKSRRRILKIQLNLIFRETFYTKDASNQREYVSDMLPFQILPEGVDKRLGRNGELL